MTGGTRPELRELVCRADSYLSLVLHRHLKPETPDDLRRDIQRTVDDLRDYYNAFVREDAALEQLVMQWRKRSKRDGGVDRLERCANELSAVLHQEVRR